MKHNLVYIAGPYTGGDVAVNVKSAMQAAHAIMDAGHVPHCPHLSHFLHIERPRLYEEWMACDFVMLARCDEVVRLPGESPGADREIVEAGKLGIPVFNSLEYWQEMHQ